MNRRTLRLACASPFLLAAPLAAQTVHVVDQAGGPGTDFTTLAAGVAAAGDGDFLLVRAGTYAEPLLLDGKGLAVQADTGAPVFVSKIVVQNLAASQNAAIRGIDWIYAAGQPELLALADNAGTVWIEEANDVDVSADFVGRATIATSADVVLRSCELARISFAGDDVASPMTGMVVTDSEVALYECTVMGGSPPDGTGVDGATGMVVTSSQVTLYASEVSGGAGGDELLSAVATDGGTGVIVNTGAVVDPVASTVSGGAGGNGIFFGDGQDGMAFMLNGGTRNFFVDSARLFTTPSPLRSGNPTTATFVGEPNECVIVLLDADPGPLRTLVGIVGPLALRLQTLDLIGFGALPASGSVTANLNAPPVASGVQSFYLQGLFLNAAGDIALGTATQVHVLDASF